MEIKPKIITQHCIKSHFFEEVMNLPKEVEITSVTFEVGFAIKRMSQPISAILTNCGVTALRKSDPSVEVEGRLIGKRTEMIKNINIICGALGLNTKTVRVKRMTVEIDGMIGVFHRMQKMIPGENDKVNKRTVLGLVRWEGDENKIARACHTNKFKCKSTMQTIRTVICEEA